MGIKCIWFLISSILSKLEQKMGSDCSTCHPCKSLKQQLQYEIENTIVESIHETPTEKNVSVSPEKSKSVNSSKGNEKKKNKKRVQIIVPVSQSSENQDNVQFKNNPIDAEDVEEIRKTMSRHFLLSQLDQSEISYIIKNLRYCTAKKNEFVFKQGDPSSSYYIILEGNCTVIINGQEKRKLNFGDSFGDLGIIYNAPRSASILADSDCLFAEMNQSSFKKITEDLNSMYEKQNRKFLETVDFYKQLNEEEKNALASDCLNETYEEGQIIFNKGDDANSFYIIKEGQVLIQEKKITLKELQSFGKNSVLHENPCVRSSTVVAKTKCKLISVNKEIIRKNLGGNLSFIMKKKEVYNLIKESQIFYMFKPEYWHEVNEKTKFQYLRKGNLIFQKGNFIPGNQIYILIGTDLINPDDEKVYTSNSVLQSGKILKGEKVTFNDVCLAEFDGFLAKIVIEMKNDEEKLKEEEIKTKKLQKSMNINDFIVLRKLRSGNFGQVYACFNTLIKKKYAIKVMDRKQIEEAKIINYIMNEEEILRQTPQHPFLVKFYKLFTDKNFIYIIMELLEGEDMFDTMSNMLPIPLNLTNFYSMQILLVLEHLHKSRVIYRDLKPQNLMISQDGYLTLVDLGTAKKLSIEKRYKTSTIVGTPHYMAPEIITGKGYSFTADLWSFGILIYEFIVGKLPFGDLLDDPFNIYEQILKTQIKFPRNVDQHSKSFINRLLNKHSQSRLGNGYEQLKNHPYFKNNNWDDVLKKKVQTTYKPNKQTIIKDNEVDKALKKSNWRALSRFLKDRKKN